MKPCAAGLVAWVLAGCASDSPSGRIAAQFAADGAVDLSTAVPAPWNRACIVGPYSNPAAEGRRLGFRWPADAQSTIAGSDTVSLLVFTHGDRVAWLEHPRRSGDVSNLSGQCFLRERAGFEQRPRPAHGWPGLFPQGR